MKNKNIKPLVLYTALSILLIGLLSFGQTEPPQGRGATWAKLETENEWSAAQNFNMTELTDGATIAWALASNQVAVVSLGGNRTLLTPTGIKPGGVYILHIFNGGDDQITFEGAYKFPGGTAPTLTVAAGSLDILTCTAENTYWLRCNTTLDVK